MRVSRLCRPCDEGDNVNDQVKFHSKYWRKLERLFKIRIEG